MQTKRETVDWKVVAEEFYNMVKDTTPETAVRVEVTSFDGVDDGVNIWPAKTNTSNAFYCTEELAIYCLYKGLSSHVSVVDGVCLARIH